jgi:signal transduction histidine kinase
MYILQFLGYFPFKSTASDFHYFSEAFRSVIFAIGIADRFYGIKKEAVQKEIEKQSLALEKEMQLKVEKTRISRELHDNIGAQLIHISMRLNSISKTFSKDSSLEVDVLKNRLNETIQQLRDTIWVINEDEITFRELEQKITTLFWYYRQSGTETQYSFQVDPELANQRISPHVAINLHRIIQEGLTNAFRHSGAKNISLTIQSFENDVKVLLNDDGVGFKMQIDPAKEHYGLENMKKRAEDCGALFSLSSEVQKGATIEVLIPKASLQLSTTTP